jgi:hypothetical protein
MGAGGPGLAADPDLGDLGLGDPHGDQHGPVRRHLRQAGRSRTRLRRVARRGGHGTWWSTPLVKDGLIEAEVLDSTHSP